VPEITSVLSVRRSLALTVCFFVLAVFAKRAHAQYSYSVLYPGDDGNAFQSTLISDASGNLYGTDLSGAGSFGAAFELANNGDGTYTRIVLHSFNFNDGLRPRGGLVMDASGNLFGTTAQGGIWGYGVLYELQKAGGSYNFVLLAQFPNWIGSGIHPTNVTSPWGNLAVDAVGNLYGTSHGVSGLYPGAVYELVNAGGNGTYPTLNTIYSFTPPADTRPGITIDASGNLFGTAIDGAGNGMVYELVDNGGGSFTFNQLYSFTGGADGAAPISGIALDANGNLYGTSSGGVNGDGVVYELVNMGGTYTEKTLYSFTGANGDGSLAAGPWEETAGVIVAANGNIFGTTQIGGANGAGTVYTLINSGGTYTERTLYSFTGSPVDDSYPTAGLLMVHGNLFGVSVGVTSGAVWELFSPPPTIQLASSENPIFEGESVTLIATVTFNSPGVPVPGSITFYAGSTVLGTAPLDQSNGTALVTVFAAELGIGSDTITARFTPSNGGPKATAQMTEWVNAESDIAILNGNNSFNGNQTVSGIVSASSFIGNGAGLNNVTAAGLACAGCISNAQLGINYAGSNTQGGDAINALALGGMPSSSYAVTGSNSFTGDQIVNGKISATGALNGTSANFTGLLSSAGLALSPTGSATVSQAFKSNPLDASASLFNSSTASAQTLLFRWQAEPVAASNNTANPSATLNLLYGGGSPAETGLSVNANGTFNFAPGQTFPGAFSGNIAESQVTNLTSDLSTNLNVAESYAANAANNAQAQAQTYANNTFVPLAGGAMTGALNLPSLNASGAVSGTSLTASGALAGGSIKVGGGTPITEYISTTRTITLPAIKARACTTFVSAALTGFTPGPTDSIALGIPGNLVGALKSGNTPIFLLYQAWETGSSPSTTVTIQVCNATATNYAGGPSGNIRIDVFKH
jgi:hypothetical protein